MILQSKGRLLALPSTPQGRLLALPTNIRLGWKSLAVTVTLAGERDI
jgi:hypothetical protein